MKKRLALVTALVVCLALGLPALARKKKEKKPEPEHVTVQHILISFENRLGPDKRIDRDEMKARYVAYQVLKRAQAGEDFDALVKEFTDDAYPGVYRLANKKVEAGPDEFQRRQMVTAFGDVAFGLEVGEIGMAQYHADMSPYGWHIIKRLE